MKWVKRILKALGLLVLNTPSILWLIFNFYGDETLISDKFGEIDISFWDTISFKYKALIYVFIVITIALTIFCLVKMYEHYREDTKIIRDHNTSKKLKIKEQELRLKTLEKASKKRVLSDRELKELEELMKEVG